MRSKNDAVRQGPAPSFGYHLQEGEACLDAVISREALSKSSATGFSMRASSGLVRASSENNGLLSSGTNNGLPCCPPLPEDGSVFGAESMRTLTRERASGEALRFRADGALSVVSPLREKRKTAARPRLRIPRLRSCVAILLN